MSEYQPGTVAMVTFGGQTLRVIRDADGEWYVPTDEAGHAFFTDSQVTDVRPLVVLDLDAPAYLIQLLRDTGSQTLSGLADQIEAQTKPARIPEPGLWGVVECRFDEGRSSSGWAVRRLDDGDHDWQDGAGDYHKWSDLIDPVLVREGVES